MLVIEASMLEIEIIGISMVTNNSSRLVSDYQVVLSSEILNTVCSELDAYRTEDKPI